MAKSHKHLLPAVALVVSLVSLYLHFTYGETAIAKSAKTELVQR